MGASPRAVQTTDWARQPLGITCVQPEPSGPLVSQASSGFLC